MRRRPRSPNRGPSRRVIITPAQPPPPGGWRHRPAVRARRPPPPRGTPGPARPTASPEAPPDRLPRYGLRGTARDLMPVRSVRRYQHGISGTQTADGEPQHVCRRPASGPSTGGTDQASCPERRSAAAGIRGVNIRGSGSYSRPAIASVGVRPSCSRSDTTATCSPLLKASQPQAVVRGGVTAGGRPGCGRGCRRRRGRGPWRCPPARSGRRLRRSGRPRRPRR